MSDEFNAKIKLLIKSEKALLGLEMKRRSRQTVWIALALLAVLTSLVMLNVTVYLYLSDKFNNLESAAILSGLNLIVAALFFIIASRQERGAEAESIEDIRDFAWDQVSTDIDEVKQHVADFKEGVVKVKKGVDSFTSVGPLAKVVPIITALVELNKKR